MKRKHLLIISAVVLISLLAIGSASAFTIDPVDGTWGYVDGVPTTSEEYPIDGIGYASGGTLAPTRQDQGFRLKQDICLPKQNINPNWPDTTRWTSQGVTWGGLGSHTSTCTNAPDLFFSEYVYDRRDGILQNDYLAIEIANFTGSEVNLGGYSVLLFTGERTFTTVNLNGSLAHGDVWVLVNDDAAGQTNEEDQRFSNSNDYRTIVLMKDTGTATEGARCDRWATGPGDSPTVYSDWDPTIQTPPNNDENQVRYGRDAFYLYRWHSYSCQITNFSEQSGFGFDGRDDPITPAALTPFFLGKFTHYNNQVFSTDDEYENPNSFEFVDLTVTVPVLCGDGQPANPPSFTIIPHLVLDETDNTAGTCIYGDPGDKPCPDKVTVEMPATNPTFQCSDGTYTVNILGFTEKGLGTDNCWESYNANAVSAAFITQEDQNNQACLWARIEQPLADISVAKTCQEWNSSERYYQITTSNVGPGFARSVTLKDTLPAGANYTGYTSQLITTSGTISQGTCTYTTETRTVDCSLGTPLLDYTTDPLAKWVVKINVNLTSGSIINTAEVSSITTDPNLANNKSTATCSVTGVTLVSFDNEIKPEGILLSWETGSEVDNLGFNIYRADSPEAEMVRINPAMILSKAMGSTSGAYYEFLDEYPEASSAFYWLETVDFALTKTLYGPIGVE